MELGKKIKQLRYKAGLTQEQLAEQLGVGGQSVSKWETGATMPDITALPLLAEIFGVTIDDLFDLSAEQRLNRIENRLDLEEELPQDVYWEYEEFLKTQLGDEARKARALSLISYLYWHQMNAAGQKVRRYAKEAIRLTPNKKDCQWMLQKAEGHAVWDWNLANHQSAINFYRTLSDENPDALLPRVYLMDNLLADHRADEAEKLLDELIRCGEKPVLVENYRAHIALARFNEPEADRIIEKSLAEHPDDDACLFEAAQYYAKKCDYEKAIALYEREFAIDPRKPRFIDAPHAIAEICEIMGDYPRAVEAYDRIIALQRDEWGLTEEVELQVSLRERARLLALAQRQN